jgi:hypothetical protein
VVWQGFETPIRAAPVSSAGVVGPQGVIISPPPGAVVALSSCASGPGTALATFSEGFSAPAKVPFGLLLLPDGGTSGPYALANAAASQSDLAVAGGDGGFKLAWDETSPGRSRIRGVDFSAAGLSADVDLAPGASFAGQPSIACDGPSCALVWLEAVSGPAPDTVVAGVSPLGSPGVALPAALSAPDAGLQLTQVAAVHGGSTWEVIAVDQRLTPLGTQLSEGGAPMGPLAVVPDLWGGDIVELWDLAAVRVGARVWLVYTINAQDGNWYGTRQSYALDQFATADVYTRTRGTWAMGAAAVDTGPTGPLEIAYSDGDAGLGMYAELFDGTGSRIGFAPLALVDGVALASDGQRQLAVGLDVDAGISRVLAQECAVDGSPSGAPFLVYASATSMPLGAVAAALAPGAFAVAWTEQDVGSAFAPQRAGLALISFSGHPDGATCITHADCASFVCKAGTCAPAPDGGLTVSGGPRSADGGVSIPDGGVLLPDGGVLLPDGGVLEPDGGVLRPDGGVVPPQGGEPRTFRLGCGCDQSAGALALLLAALAMGRSLRRRSGLACTAPARTSRTRVTRRSSHRPRGS